MDKLYDLTFYSNPDGDYENGFFIGLFLTQEEAENVAKRYCKEVSRFKDYDCDYRIIAFPVIGAVDRNEMVYRFSGWNTNEALDEVDILISNCFASQEHAETALPFWRRLPLRMRPVADRWYQAYSVI